MSIEIKQLHVRSQIVQREPHHEAHGAQDSEREAALQKAVLDECRRMIATALNKQKER